MSDPLPRHSAWLLASLLAAVMGCASPGPRLAPLSAAPIERGVGPADETLSYRPHGRTSDLVVTAMSFLGRPYRHGGSSAEEGFDCSGFTRHIFGLSLGVALPRSADDQASARGMVPIELAELRPGDLVFFNTLKRTFSHVGIYIGEDRFIHSPRSGSEVRIENMRYAYWAQRFTGARRAAEPTQAGQATLLDTTR